MWSVAEGHCVHTEENAHARRIKGITQLPSEEVASTGKGGARHHAFATACSNGIVSVWRLSTSSGSVLSSGKTSAGGQSGKTGAGAATLQRLFSIETRLRLTAISVSTPARVVTPSPREAAPPSTAPVAPANKRTSAAQEAEGGDDEVDDAAEEADAVEEAPREKKRKRATVDSGVPMSRAQSSRASIEDSEPSLTKVLKKRKKKENLGVGATPE